MDQAEDELRCDFAEFYRIYEIKGVQPFRAASFACGLREGSRTKLKMSGREYDLKTELLAAIADRLSFLVWFQTEDGKRGKNRPELFCDILFRDEEEAESVGFGSVEELAEAFRKFAEEVEDGN